MVPTTEQSAATDLALTGNNLTIEALAGCGKTSTLKLIAQAKRQDSGVYVSFNKAIVEEARTRFPSSVACSTAHSLAYKAVGYKYQSRLNGQRQLYSETARVLEINEKLEVIVEGTVITLSINDQVHAVKEMIERFCQGGDKELNEAHIAVPELLRPWAKEYRAALVGAILPAAQRMWEEIVRPKGRVPFSHGNYLKLWQLSSPKIETDYLLFDEAQDANGVMLAIVNDQQCQRIFVGDSFQQIYGWNGAVNAMQKTTGNRCWLTESWRFGQGIADVANGMLERLESPAKLIGRGPESQMGLLTTADALLFRTNAGCISSMFARQAMGQRFHIVGGVAQLQSFTEAAERMQRKQYPKHQDLNCFATWADVVDFVKTDEAAGDLVRFVGLIEQHGTKKIMNLLAKNQPDERSADVTISTVHKAKGREWDSVIIGNDFASEATQEEKRLLYVAATRAKKALDYSSVKGHFTGEEHHECA